jgi:hypothetical protein
VITTYFQAWLAAFLLTELVEVPLYRWLAPVSCWRAASLSAVTHPAVWYVIPPLCYGAGLRYAQMIVLAEVFAWSVEALMLIGFGVRAGRAFAVSLIANGASVLVGAIARAWLGMP